MRKTKKMDEIKDLEKKMKSFFKSNPKIKDAIKLFKISEKQYIRAMESMDPQITTSNKVFVEI
jgi:hypothetical protein